MFKLLNKIEKENKRLKGLKKNIKSIKELIESKEQALENVKGKNSRCSLLVEIYNLNCELDAYKDAYYDTY